MKKSLYFILLFLLIFPLKVFAEDTITVIYNANDGSGRTKTFEMPKGDEYTFEDGHIFEHIDPNPNDSMDDLNIAYWTTEADGGSIFIGTYRNNPYDPYHYEKYNYINNSTSLTLYAQWEGRKNIASGITSITPTGDAIVTNDDGSYTIKHDASFELVLKLQETSSIQFNRLSYLELPDYFIDYLEEEPDIKAYYEKARPFIISITYKNEVYRATCYSYIEGNKLFINMLEGGTKPNQMIENTTNLSLTFRYWVKAETRKVNNRWLLVKTVMYNNHEEAAEEIFPKGKIVVHYIDVDTKEELDSISTTNVLGVSYTPDGKIFNGYKLIESPNNNYEYEDYEQVIYYKYKKLSNIPQAENTQTLSNGTKTIKENPNTSVGIPLLLFVFFLITGVLFTVLDLQKKKRIKRYN